MNLVFFQQTHFFLFIYVKYPSTPLYNLIHIKPFYTYKATMISNSKPSQTTMNLLNTFEMYLALLILHSSWDTFTFSVLLLRVTFFCFYYSFDLNILPISSGCVAVAFIFCCILSCRIALLSPAPISPLNKDINISLLLSLFEGTLVSSFSNDKQHRYPSRPW